MAELQMIKVLITPEFDSTKHIESLLFKLTVEVPQYDKACAPFGQNVFRPDVTSGSVPSNDSQALNNFGRIMVGEINGNTEWIDTNSSSEVLRMLYRVTGSKDGNTLLAPRGIHRDQGGILGSGVALIPPSLTSSNQMCRIILEWDLRGSPEGTRTVWTFGEGPAPVEKIGPVSLLRDSVYMVGPIRGNIPAPVPGSLSDYYGYYWFGSLPSNLEVIKDIHHDFFLKVSNFFDDTPSAENPYRSFVLNTSSHKSFGGTAFPKSQIFFYDDQIDKAEDYDLIRQMSHEIVHNFLGPASDSPEVDWLFEGIKNTLPIYMPFRNRFRTGDYFSSTLSQLCMKYYTNPLINLPQDELLKLAPTNEYAKELLGSRAWAFVIGTDFRARKMSEMMRPIEDLAIKVLAKKRAAGEPYGVEQWISLLEPLMGDEARQRYEQMCSGATILLPVEVFGAKTHRLLPIKQEILDFGMDRRSFELGTVKGLKQGSRAEEAGLKEDDLILWTSHPWICVDHFVARMELMIERDGNKIKVEYWPRAYEKCDSWIMGKVEV